MSLNDEKRKRNDRRVGNDSLPPGRRERRGSMERRQTEVSEITFFEWASHFVKYQGQAVAEAEAIEAAHAAEVLSKSRH